MRLAVGLLWILSRGSVDMCCGGRLCILLHVTCTIRSPTPLIESKYVHKYVCAYVFCVWVGVISWFKLAHE
jgi:hypothetical protein